MANNMANKYIYINHKPKIDNSDNFCIIKICDNKLFFYLSIVARSNYHDRRV